MSLVGLPRCVIWVSIINGMNHCSTGQRSEISLHDGQEGEIQIFYRSSHVRSGSGTAAGRYSSGIKIIVEWSKLYKLMCRADNGPQTFDSEFNRPLIANIVLWAITSMSYDCTVQTRSVMEQGRRQNRSSRLSYRKKQLRFPVPHSRKSLIVHSSQG